MKPIEISQSSWHYKIVYFFNGRDRINDICEYRWAFLRGAAMVAILSAIIFGSMILVLLMSLADMITGLLFSLWYQTWMLSAMGEGFLIATAILLGVGATAIAFYHVKMYIPRSKTGIVGEMYRSAKEKYCVPVDFKE